MHKLSSTLFHIQKITVVKMSSKKTRKTKAENVAAESVNVSAVSLDKSKNIVIKVLAKPGAKQNAVTEISEDGVGIQINAPPVDGEANAELLKYLSNILRLRKSELCLEKGLKSRQKVVKVHSDLISCDDVLKFLKEEILEK